VCPRPSPCAANEQGRWGCDSKSCVFSSVFTRALSRFLPCPLSLPPPLPRITHAATHISLLSHVTSRPRTRVLVWPAQRSPAHCPRSRGWASHHSRLRAQSAAAAAAAFCQPPRGRSVLSGSFCADAMSAWLGLGAGLGLGLGPGSVIRVRVRVSGQWEGEVAVGL